MSAAAGPPLDGPGTAPHAAATLMAVLARAALAAPLTAAAPALAGGLAGDLARDLGGSLTATSDYVYHGLSSTCGGPAVQADAHLGTAGGKAPGETFAGVWGSLGLGSGGCRAAREVDAYAGQRLALGAAQSLTVTYVHYAFPGGTYLYQRLEGRRFDYDQIGGTWAFEDRLYLTAAWTPDAIGYRGYGDRGYEVERSRHALSFDAEAHQPLGGFTLSAGAGYDEVSDPTGAGYAFWSAGLGHALGPVQLDVAYFRTAPRAERLFGPEIAGGRVAATAVWAF